jgi:hypothetical protein
MNVIWINVFLSAFGVKHVLPSKSLGLGSIFRIPLWKDIGLYMCWSFLLFVLSCARALLLADTQFKVACRSAKLSN